MCIVTCIWVLFSVGVVTAGHSTGRCASAHHAALVEIHLGTPNGGRGHASTAATTSIGGTAGGANGATSVLGANAAVGRVKSAFVFRVGVFKL